MSASRSRDTRLPGFRESDWVRFPGRVERRTRTESVLIPADNPDQRWYLFSADVRTVQDGGGRESIFLRRGGTVRNIITAQSG
jgi:hypothetical protein